MSVLRNAAGSFIAIARDPRARPGIVAQLAMAFLSVSSASLRSSLFHPGSFRRDFHFKNGSNSSKSSCVNRGRCVAGIAVPELAEAMRSGVGLEAHQSMIQLYNNVLFSAVKLGVPLPVDENALAYWAVAVPAAFLYSTATPGPIAGLADFLQGHINAMGTSVYRAYEVEIGRQIGEGSFGIVYEGFVYKGGKRPGKQPVRVVLKKSKAGVAGGDDMRNAEIHMNHRLQRTAAGACAEFLGTVDVPSSQARGKLSEGVWLIWKYQGYQTLHYCMRQNNFPENIANIVLGQKMTKNRDSKATPKNRDVLVIRRIMQQVLTNLHDLHRSGVVHRDLKPLNLVLSEDSGSFKLIDLGACVDIRSGFNYTPDETVIDPTYAAPEHYVMPTSTPTLPPDPLCSMISPIVWFLNTPDRFDLYSAGLILMQLSVKQLRHDVGLQSFNTQFKRTGFDLDVWRKRCSISSEEFAILDADGGAGWELAKAMLQRRHDKASSMWPWLRSSRPSAAAALRHRFIRGTLLPRPLNISNLVPDLTSFPSLPSLSSLPSLPSLGQLQVPAFSSKSAVESAVGQLRTMQEAAGNIDTGRVRVALEAAFPTAATSAFVLAICWMALTTLENSAHASYDMGRWMIQTMGLSGSACLAFFLFIKPWLEEQESANRTKHESNYGLDTEQLVQVEKIRNDSPLYDQVKLLPAGREPGTVRFKTGLSEAVLAMEAQLASLEASIQREQDFSATQRETLTRVEKLLITPTGVAYASSSEGTDLPLSTNGAYVAKPFSKYIS